MNERFDRLCEAFILTEPGDDAGLKLLRYRLDEMMPSIDDARVAGLLTDIGDAVDRLRGGDTQAWLDVSTGMQSLQELLGGGHELPAVGLPEATSAPAPKAIDPDLLEGFVQEVRENVEAAEAELLAAESGSPREGAVHTIFRAFHTIKGAAGCLDFDAMSELAHETENLLELARKGELPLAGAATDLVYEAIDAMKRLASDVEEGHGQTPADPLLQDLVHRLRERLSSRGDAPSSVTMAAAPEEKPAAKEPVRVDAERLDRLVDLIGELVIAESMVSQSGELRGLAAGGTLGKSVSQLDKITRELQEMGMSLRMVPARPLFQKMARLVRDLSRKLDKRVELVTVGEEIEIDKAVVHCLTEALGHLLRNAMDHGLEATEERIKAGKPETGRLELRAFQREGSIVIEVEDDGRGLDRDAILAKAIEKGLIRKGEGMSEEDVFKLIFLPGFSTAKTVTELSGRGVGLDVVRSGVEALRGRVEVQSVRGQGTRFRLRLPLTMAIIDGMVIRSGGERFIVPTLSITRLVKPDEGQRSTSLGRAEMLSLQDELVPLFRLSRLLDVTTPVAAAAGEIAVVVEEGGRRAALLADEVLGQQQIVIKSLGLDLEGVSGISGGVILPDGQVGLILDVGGLLAVTTATAGRDAA